MSFAAGWSLFDVQRAQAMRGPLYVWRATNDPDIATVWTGRLTPTRPNGEPANPPTLAEPARETAGQSTTFGQVRDEPTGVVLQPVADSPHDPDAAR